MVTIMIGFIYSYRMHYQVLVFRSVSVRIVVACGPAILSKKCVLNGTVSYLRSLVVRAVHRHRTGVGSIPAGGPYS